MQLYFMMVKLHFSLVLTKEELMVVVMGAIILKLVAIIIAIILEHMQLANNIINIVQEEEVGIHSIKEVFIKVIKNILIFMDFEYSLLEVFIIKLVIDINQFINFVKEYINNLDINR
jgi:hypothetical protein